MDDLKQLALRVPSDIKTWLTEQAKLHGSSQNSEVIRAVREKMAREAACGAVYDATGQTAEEFADGFLRHTARRAVARIASEESQA